LWFIIAEDVQTPSEFGYLSSFKLYIELSLWFGVAIARGRHSKGSPIANPNTNPNPIP